MSASSSPPPDLAVQAVSQDLDAAFDQLFAYYEAAVSRFFGRKGFAAEEIRDLTQETFLRVYKGMQASTPESPRKWVFTIAANVYKNELRARGTDKRAGDEVSLESALEQGRPVPGLGGGGVEAAPPEGALDSLLAKERRTLLARCLETLPPRMRRCVLLRLNQGLKYKEIALIMQTSVETVKAQLFQARLRLREQLGAYFDDFDL